MSLTGWKEVSDEVMVSHVAGVEVQPLQIMRRKETLHLLQRHSSCQELGERGEEELCTPFMLEDE